MLFNSWQACEYPLDGPSDFRSPDCFKTTFCMLQVVVKCRGDRGASKTDSKSESGRKSGAVSSNQLVYIIVEVRVEDVLTSDPVGQESDDSGLNKH